MTMTFNRYPNRAAYVAALVELLNRDDVDDVLPTNYSDDYGLTYRPNVCIFFKDGNGVSLRWHAMETDERNSFMSRKAKYEAAQEAAELVKEARKAVADAMLSAQMDMVRDARHAADFILNHDEFATNVQVLNAMFGVNRDCAAWSAKFGFNVATEWTKLPYNVKAAMLETQRIVARARGEARGL